MRLSKLLWLPHGKRADQERRSGRARRLGLSVTVAVAAAVAVLAFFASQASATSVSGVSFTGASEVAGATTTYTVDFTNCTSSSSPNCALASGSTITVTFDTAYNVVTPTITLGSDFSSCTGTGVVSGTSENVVTITLSNHDGTCSLPHSDPATLTISGVTNPTTAETYSDLSVATNEATTAVDGSVTITPAAANQLAFTPATPGPGTVGSAIPSVAVSVEDQYGNVVTTASGSVVMSIKSGSPQSSFTSGTTTVSVASGIATFSNLVVHTAGSYTFTATPSSISGVTTAVNSNAFTVNASSTVASLAISTISSPQTAGTGFSVTVTAKDAYGNTANNSSDSIQLGIASGSPQSTFSSSGTPSTLSGTLSGGTVTFPASSVVFDTASATDYVLTAKDATVSVSAPNSNGFTVQAAGANKVVWITQPGTATAGSAIPGTPSGSPTVEVEDQYNNPVSGATVTMAVTTGPGSSFASGSTTSVSSGSNGQSAFSNLILDTAGTTYTITASDGSIHSAASSTFTVNASSTVASLAISTISSPQTAGTGFSVTVTAKDAYGNTANNSSDSIQLGIASGSPQSTFSSSGTPSTLSGTLSGGTVTFPASSVVFDTASATDYVLTAKDATVSVTRRTPTPSRSTPPRRSPRSPSAPSRRPRRRGPVSASPSRPRTPTATRPTTLLTRSSWASPRARPRAPSRALAPRAP